MFVRDFIHVAQPFESVAPRFVADASWLNGLAEDAAANARQLTGSVRLVAPPRGADGRRAGTVQCETGPVRVRRDSLVVPLHIAGSDGEALPTLEADLEVSPVGPGLSQLTLSATYRRTGPSAADDAIVQRAAEVVARTFLQALAGRIDEDDGGS
ncbi:MAG TPA: hypothetical protein VFC99_14670 [Acidimicrobiia bacterium]|nr:hypothetical protein [Acidimicrobiia bacterium]